MPVQFRHVVEVHSVHGSDERRREENCRPRRDLLDLLVLRVACLRQIAHLLVLVLRHQSCVHREDVSEQLTKAVGPLHHSRRMVGDVAQVSLEFLVRVVLVEPCRQPTQHSQQRTRRPLEFDHLTGQFVDATRNSGIATEYFGFDLVDVVLQSGHHRGVPVDDCVENGIENGLGTQPQQVRIVLHASPHRRQIRRFTVTDGQNEVRTTEDVQLAEFDPLGLVAVPRSTQHHEQCLAVALELGALVRDDRILDRQFVEVEMLCSGIQLGVVGPVHADPRHRLRIRKA